MVGLTIDHEGGKRETDELVKYDKTNIIKRNEWGYEVGVDKNGNIISKAVESIYLKTAIYYQDMENMSII